MTPIPARPLVPPVALPGHPLPLAIAEAYP